MPSIKQVLPAEKTKGVRAFVRTPFHTPCPASIVCYTFSVYCRAVISLPLHKGAFGLCALNGHLLFLTSTAFVDTKAKPRARRGNKSRLFGNFFQSINKHFITSIGTQNGNFIINFQPFKQRLRTIAVRLHDPSATRVSAKNW